MRDILETMDPELQADGSVQFTLLFADGSEEQFRTSAAKLSDLVSKITAVTLGRGAPLDGASDTFHIETIPERQQVLLRVQKQDGELRRQRDAAIARNLGQTLSQGAKQAKGPADGTQ